MTKYPIHKKNNINNQWFENKLFLLWLKVEKKEILGKGFLKYYVMMI